MGETRDIPEASFHDERIKMGYWRQRLTDAGVRTPETYELPLDHDGDGAPGWDTNRAVVLTDDLGGEAFVRTPFKSAQMGLLEGSYIHDPTPDAVDETIGELLSQQAMMQMPVGETLYLREWLDLDWVTYSRDTHHPEVRVFLRDGEVVCHHPRLEAAEVPEWDTAADAARDIIKRDWNGEIRPMAERAAAEFEGDGWFSLDFVCTTDWEWYATDMAVDALYERGGELRGISQHPGDCKHDIERLAGE